MIRVTRGYRFSASHRLHVDSYSEEKNDVVFGKCNNPFGHGHNYEIFITVRGPVDPDTGLAVDTRRLDDFIETHVVTPFHNKNMNLDVPAFSETVATTENVAVEICTRIQKHWTESFPGEWPVFEKVRIHETARNIFEAASKVSSGK